MKLIWSKRSHPFKSDILWFIYYISIWVYKRVRAGLVRRLIWVEEYLCSNHNDPNVIIYINTFFFANVMYTIYSSILQLTVKMYIIWIVLFLLYKTCITYKYTKKFLWNHSYMLKRGKSASLYVTAIYIIITIVYYRLIIVLGKKYINV